MLASTPSRRVLALLGITAAAVAAVALFVGTARPARAYHGTAAQHQLKVGAYSTQASRSANDAQQSCKRQSNLSPGSPGWNQLDPWIQNAILNRLRAILGPQSPGWDQLDPWIQSAILNRLASRCAA